VTLFLLLVLVLIAFAATPGGTGVCLGWTVLAIFAGLLLIIDLLFLDESAFLFEPDFDAWQAKSNSPY